MIHVLPANLFGLLFIKSYYNVIKDLIVENNFLYKSNGSLQPKSNNKCSTEYLILSQRKILTRAPPREASPCQIKYCEGKYKTSVLKTLHKTYLFLF